MTAVNVCVFEGTAKPSLKCEGFFRRYSYVALSVGRPFSFAVSAEERSTDPSPPFSPCGFRFGEPTRALRSSFFSFVSLRHVGQMPRSFLGQRLQYACTCDGTNLCRRQDNTLRE